MSESSPQNATPLVSVIVRSMNRPSLAATLASSAAQDAAPVEVVVVAACGPGHPALPERCGPHALRLVQSATPLSRPAAANAGLDAAAGDWITFLDDDDAMLEGHLRGLVAARARAPSAEVIHCRARGVFADGSMQRFGNPLSLLQLYERNYLHLSAVLFARSLVARGCRFDLSLPMHEDWDFFIQLAQHTTFHFIPDDTVQWNVEAGTSGGGGGINQNDAEFARCRDLVYARWSAQHDALFERVEPILRDAATRAQRGDLPGAAQRCADALAVSGNDPWALNLLASVQRMQGRGEEARRSQELAVALRPFDPVMIYNLALLYRAQGDIERTRLCCDRALVLDPEFDPAKKLRAAVAA